MVRIEPACFRRMPALALIAQEVITLFREHFGAETVPTVYRAPGRVNLIGEHTDYNLGFVFPIALDRACYVAIAPAAHGKLRFYSRDLEEEFALPVAELFTAKPTGKWSDYPVGVARELVKAGITLSPADLFLASEVPSGSGLSSSAALEISTAVALLGGQPMDGLPLALLGQRAETQFVGVPTGIMDQYASVFGRSGHAIQIDCRSLTHKYVAVPRDAEIIAVNSLVKHELGGSAYRDRVAECNAAVVAIQEVDADVKSLRDVSPEQFSRIQDSVPLVPRRRARHIVTENARVLDFAAAMSADDVSEMGRLFVASHRSMQYDYEISCEEIDFLVDTAIKLPGVYGSRMTGGGFGGCTVNLVAPDAVQPFRQSLSQAYLERYGKEPEFYVCTPAEGAGRA